MNWCGGNKGYKTIWEYDSQIVREMNTQRAGIFLTDIFVVNVFTVWKILRKMKRSIFNLIVLISLLTGGFISCNRQQKPEASRPNILFFLVDDLGWEDTSVPFWHDSVENNRYLRTPHIARLAAEGMKFTNAYASSPVCSPTRTALMTGMNPARTHITNWIPGRGNHPADDQRLLIPHWRINGLDKRNVTLPELLKAAGYTTVHIGKAHLGKKDSPGADPRHLGFDYSIAASYRGSPGSYYVPYGRIHGPDSQMIDLEEFFPDSLYLNDALTIMALRMLDTLAGHPEKPFYFNMWHYAVHAPIQGDPKRLEKYRLPGKTEAQVQYASMVESVDNSFGRIMKKLDELGMAGNTIVIFWSDNGGLVSHSGPPTTNYPLCSGKGSSREGGYREPLIIRWPGKVKEGTVCSVPVIADDFFPTVLSMAGIPVPDTLRPLLDGTDITPLLLQTGDIQRPHPPVWHYPHYWGWKALREADSTITPFSAIREGDWKLIYTYEKGRCELYNLAEDIGEQHNLAGAKPEITQRLCKDLHDVLQGMGAQTPICRETGKALDLPHFSGSQ